MKNNIFSSGVSMIGCAADKGRDGLSIRGLLRGINETNSVLDGFRVKQFDGKPDKIRVTVDCVSYDR